jgi:hypothetical protein
VRETVVFAGPSLPDSDRVGLGPFVWRPPAARGDLDRLGEASDIRVVLVDGYLVHGHPPSPTEVHRLVERGAEVWGCSSLGALRAAELRFHGVHGSGWVFDRIVDRTITADDELVADLDPRSGHARGVFLANVRFGLTRLVTSSRVAGDRAAELLATLGAMHFAARTVDTVRAAATVIGMDGVAIQQLLAADVKRDDARALLHFITAREVMS